MDGHDETALAWLREALERSEAQIAAGHAVPLEPVLERLRASIARMRAGQTMPGPDDSSEA